MDELYMKKALSLSLMGMGKTNPNPLVGAVIVKDNRIIGKGYHEYYGGPHAEVSAINNATEDVEGSTMYVTLEPCSHYGKTPPCVNLLIDKKFAKVAIAMLDPNPLVAGRGAEILRENGIEVSVGILEAEAKKTNEIFIKYISEKKPFCILKTATSLDGKIATTTGESKWITNETSREYVHELRNKVSGIMVGVNTVIADNPSLTTRLKSGGTDAVRIIVDTSLRIPIDSNVIRHNSIKKTIIATTEKADKDKLSKLESLEGIQVIMTPMKNNKVDLNYLFDYLGGIGIDSVLLEGGATLNFSMIQEGLVDKVITFIAPKLIGGEKSKTSIGGEGFEKLEDAVLLRNLKVKNFGEDIMIEGYIRKEC